MLDDDHLTKLLGPKCPACEWRQRPGREEAHMPGGVFAGDPCPRHRAEGIHRIEG